MIVYVVTKGQWEDYSIVGIYSTKEKAEEKLKELFEFGKEHPFTEDIYEASDIEEWEVE